LIAAGDLTVSDIGKTIVVTAKSPGSVVLIGSPPPPGMITPQGPLTIYRGTLAQIEQESIRIRAPFPEAPDTFKSVGIQRHDIITIQLGK
jgi:hypothetical protein